LFCKYFYAIFCIPFHSVCFALLIPLYLSLMLQAWAVPLSYTPSPVDPFISLQLVPFVWEIISYSSHMKAFYTVSLKLYCFIIFVFFFFSTGLNSGLKPWGTPPDLFCDGFFRDRVSQTTCLGLLWNIILLISASWVVRITGVSHQHPAHFYFLQQSWSACNRFSVDGRRKFIFFSLSIFNWTKTSNCK
jgi:hypothetical protein